VNDLRSRPLFVRGRCSLALAVGIAVSFEPNVAIADDSNGKVSYEIREQVTTVFLPAHDYAVTGMCATGSGLAPASVYAPGATGRGWGMGAGIGGRIGYQRPTRPPNRNGSTWWGFRGGGGLDLAFFYASVPTGISDMSGMLCERVKANGAQVDYKASSVLLLQASLYAGAELGLGTAGADNSWRGIVLGAALVPAINFLQPWVTRGDFDGSYLGTELTLDFASWHPGPEPQDPAKRISLFLLLPPQHNGPVILTVGLGAVWY
jgi:hypothetical protein